MAVAADAAFGSPLALRSPLGYSLVAGARYYGIGNEYMGIVLGGLAVGLGGLLQWRSVPWSRGRWLMAGGMATAAAVLGAPELGVNFGGAMAAAVTTAIVFTGLGGPSRRRRQPARASASRRPFIRAARGLGTKEALVPLLITAAAAVVVTAGLLIAGEAARGEEVSHIGLGARRAAAGDWAGIAAIVTGKIKTNLRLFRWTIWMRALVVGLGGMVLLSFRPKGEYRRFVAGHPYLGTGLAAAAGGAVAALFFNDSGVVAAATAMIIPAATILRVLLYGEKKDNKGAEGSR